MIRTAVACAAAGWLLAANPTAAQEVQRSAHHDFRTVTVADGLDVPWSIAWLPDGDMLVTERPGRLRIVRDGTLLPDPVPGVPEVVARGQGGLFEVLPHPDFAANRLLYLSYARPTAEGSTTAVDQGPLRGRSAHRASRTSSWRSHEAAATTGDGSRGTARATSSLRWATGWRGRGAI